MGRQSATRVYGLLCLDTAVLLPTAPQQNHTTSSARHMTSRTDVNLAVVPSECRLRSHSGVTNDVTPVACHLYDNYDTDEHVLRRQRPISTLLLDVVRRDLRNDIRDIANFSTLLINRMVRRTHWHSLSADAFLSANCVFIARQHTAADARY